MKTRRLGFAEKNNILAAILSVFVSFPFSAQAQGKTETDDLVLHYDRPAEFFEEALVIGNGTIGATVYGGTKQDKISLNDITLWTGEPDRVVTSPDAHKAIPGIRALLEKEDYRAANKEYRKVQGHYSENYQPLGTLTIEHLDPQHNVSAYQRRLNISNATAQTQYLRDGALFETEYFASAPDSAIIVRMKTQQKEGMRTRISLDSQLPHNTYADGNVISSVGYAAYHSLPSYVKGSDKFHYDSERGIHFRTMIKVIADNGGTLRPDSSGITIEGCKEVTLLIVNATSFNGFDKDPVKEGKDYKSIAENRLNSIEKKSFDNMRKAHIKDYKRFFDRVSIHLGNTEPQIKSLPTDRQLFMYTDQRQHNPELEALYFQYGRYLLISCSRTPGIPANLQGLWNERILPPWSSNYTSNINLEENYWAAETTNLSEMHAPLLEFIRNLSSTGEITAKAYYGVDEGWCLAHNTDIWAMTCPVGLNSGDPTWACWNMGGAWVSTHIWEHFLFTQDKEYLRQNYPILKGAADFCMNWLTPLHSDPRWLITSPGTSPENKFLTSEGYASATLYGGTADLAMIRECLIDTKEAAKALGADKEYQQKIDSVLARLLPYRIGKKGNLQEWFHDWEDEDPKHRHQSHLFGMYPGHHLSLVSTPAEAEACKRTLEIKGNETTGWSTGWRVNLYARLRETRKAYETYRTLLRYVSPDQYKGTDAKRGGGTYPNLLDAHSPFQIDGNFGGCAGVAEMLIQSSPEEIELLPALPLEWNDGEVKGLCARGGFVIDMKWTNGKVRSLRITSRQGGETQLKFNGQTMKVSIKEGKTKTIVKE